MTTYEIRYCPDSWPSGEYDTFQRAYSAAIKLANKRQLGPYLIYKVTEHGESFVCEAD